MLLFADLQYMPLFLNVGICYLSKTLAVGYPRYKVLVHTLTSDYWLSLATTEASWEAVGQTKEMSASTRPQSTQMFLSDNRWQSWHHSSRRSRRLEEEKNRISPKVLYPKYCKKVYLWSGTQKYFLKKNDLFCSKIAENFSVYTPGGPICPRTKKYKIYLSFYSTWDI